jgi:hypothetical protein
MDWGTLVGTALGAAVGVGTTMLAERSRWKRDHSSREQSVKRQLYGEYLAALSLTTHRLRDLRRSPSLALEDRVRQAGEILGSGGAYGLRYQLLITAPEPLGHMADQAFTRLRDLRDCFDEPDVRADPQWNDALSALTDALKALRAAMRDDLAAS